MIKVLHIISNLSGGGAERQFSYLISGFVAKGHDVHVAYLNDRSFPLNEFPSVHFYRIRSYGNYDPRILYQLVRLTFKINPDFIQSWILQSDIFAAIIAVVTKTKWIMREPNAPFLRENKGVKFIIRDLLSGLTSAIVANSYSGIDYWKSKYPRKVLRVIRNGFPIDKIVSQKSLLSDHWCRTMPYVLYVGRLESQKNVCTLLEAMVYVDCKMNLLICGSGSFEKKCREKIKELGLEKRVFLLGNVSSDFAYALMRHAYVLLLVSHYEGFPNVLIESMLNKCPIVVSEIDPHIEFLDKSTAVFANKDCPEDIAASIKQVLDDVEGTKMRIDNAFEMVSKYSIEHMVDSYESLYLSLR